MKRNGISKRPQRSRRKLFLRALVEYLTSDSYMYGPLQDPLRQPKDLLHQDHFGEQKELVLLSHN